MDLDEEKELRKLMGEYDELQKSKEEQDERLENLKFKNKDLEDTRTQYEEEIFKMADDIGKVNLMIKETEQKTKDKEA